ncbi:MAG: DMT family transporter [Pseudomonadota bacterium]
MPPQPAPARALPPLSSSASRGIALMIAAIFMFSLMDVAAKAISARADTIMALWARYAGQMLIVTLIVLPRLRSVTRTRYPGVHFARSLLLLMASTFAFFGIARLGLAEATAVMATNPVLITLGAAVFLGERLGWRRLAGIGAALCGAMIIIRPGTDVFSLDALLPLGAATCFACFAVLTRKVGRDESPWTSLFYTAMVGGLVLSVAVPWFWVPPDLTTVAWMVFIGLAGAAGQLLFIRALSVAEAGTVAPFSYCSVVFATILGFLIFAEVPDALTLMGALVIICAGLYVWRRETRAVHEAGPQA